MYSFLLLRNTLLHGETRISISPLMAIYAVLNSLLLFIIVLFSIVLLLIIVYYCIIIMLQ